MSEENDDKPFEASEQKLQRAREKGDIARSTELNVAAMYLGAALAFGLAASFAVKRWLSMTSRAVGVEGWAPDATFMTARAIGGFAGWATVGLATVPAIAILICLVLQRGLVFAPQKLAPDIKRINPVSNAKQKFGISGLVNFGISLCKVTLVCIGGWLMFRALLDRLAGSAMGGGRWVGDLGLILGRVLLMALAISVVIGAVDMGWRWFDHRRKNRMTRKEMEDEYKENEGDPHLKAARRQKAIDMATRQMLADVAKADVIIVNPTHYAVALEWKRGSGKAPVCLAKGVDEVAARIRERAKDHKVPIWSDPPCARAIHATVDVGREIRHEHFAAVAAAIRFAEQMRQKARTGW